MLAMGGRRFALVAAALSVTALAGGGCAVGPDFLVPSAPQVGRYTREPLASRTQSADVPRQGQAQHFVNGRYIPAEWWALYRSTALNSLIRRAIDTNPNLQSTMAALRAAKENVYSQQGKYFPLVQANFNPTRQQTSAPISSALNSGASIYSLITGQLLVSYTVDAFGLNRRTVESLQATADVERFQVEAAYLTLTSNVVVAAIQEASLRGQIEETNRVIDINLKMLQLLRTQFAAGYVTRNDVALQEAALAQIRATLPPLRKALAQQRDLLAALAGRFPTQEPAETFRLTELRLPTELPVSLPADLVRQRPDVRAAEEQLHSASSCFPFAAGG
jgi:NodT family efflux transporter outer membrane factor (OMF) lipoprotein